MIQFKAEIERFAEMGEKTGWSYIFIPQSLAAQLKKDCRKSFRVKGKIDDLAVEGMALVPMGEGDFILALKAALRKKIKKEAGATVQLALMEDETFEIRMPDDLELCLADEPEILAGFLKMPKSHQNWYINWLNSAKTDTTRTKRIVKIISSLNRGMDFGEMLREGKTP